MKKVNLALVGATGLVGQRVIECLKEENLLDKINLTLYTSKNGADKDVIVNGERYKTKRLETVEKFDIVIFSAGEEVSRQYAPKFASLGAYVIDNSNVFRREKSVPLVVPEINSNLIQKQTRIIANPNCSTIQLVLVLERLNLLSNIEKVIVSTYQSVSGAGSEALQDLFDGTKYFFPSGIKDNLITQIGEINSNGFCLEEDKLMFETKKILNEDLDICATSVRVPIPICHGESVYIKFKNSVEKDKIFKALKCDYIEAGDSLYYPRECAGSNKTYVSRIRNYSENEVLLFILADNLRRGAGYNAVKIAEYIMDKIL